jgi:hypothetical protein
MKIIYAAVIASCYVSSTSANVAKCQTDVGGRLEVECGEWRNQFPRPALYMKCTEGYESGI